MRKGFLAQNALVGAAAIVVAAGYFAPQRDHTGPVLNAAVSFVNAGDSSASPTATTVTATDGGEVVGSGVEAAVSAFSGVVRGLSHPEALTTAFKSYFAFKSAHPDEVRKPYLYFVDFGLPATAKRGYVFDMEKLHKMASDWPGLEGMDLARDVSRLQVERWTGGKWRWGQGYEMGGDDARRPHVVAVDYGNKRNIFRLLVEAGARVTVVPATASFEEIMGHEPDGFFLSNGPGDPAATGEYAVPVIRQMLETRKPLFGICLGHQMLALAVGGRTSKMFQGHRGANHPVKRLSDGRVEITSMNHGFAVERQGLPENVRETHVSLFDGSNCGIELTDRPAFSVQYHPEASPGPQDSFYLFEKFVEAMQ